MKTANGLARSPRSEGWRPSQLDKLNIFDLRDGRNELNKRQKPNKLSEFNQPNKPDKLNKPNKLS